MSTDLEPDVVQPEDAGQGDGGHDAPYAEYLNRIPEEVREEVEPVFKDWDANVTRRFQEHSEYRREWEPYEQTGINRLSPEETQWLVQFRQALEDPQQIKQWYEGYAEQAGIVPEQAAQEPTGQQASTTFDEFGAGYDPQQLQSLLDQRFSPLAQQLQQLTERFEHQDYQTRVAEAERYVQGQIEELKAKHPDEFNEEAIEKLVTNYIDSDPVHAVERAFADWQKIRAQIERDTLQGKADSRSSGESGGTADAMPEMPKTLKEAAEIAKQRIRESWGT